MCSDCLTETLTCCKSNIKKHEGDENSDKESDDEESDDEESDDEESDNEESDNEESDEEEKTNGETRGNPLKKSVSKKALRRLLFQRLGIKFSKKTEKDVLLLKCAQIGCLTADQWKQAMPQFKVMKCYLHSCVENKKFLNHIEQIVLLASKFWALGSRLLNAWIMECYENDVLNKKDFDNTLNSEKFIRHVLRCGRIQNGLINRSLMNSHSLSICQKVAPSLDDMIELLPLKAWGQIFNSLQKTYIASLKEHVTRHMKTRIQSHLKRFIHSCPDVKLKKQNYQTIVTNFYGHVDFGLSLVYENIGKEDFDDALPEEIKKELQLLQSFCGKHWKTLVTAKAIPYNKEMFDLHLYLRSKIPMMEEENTESEDNQYSTPTRVSIENIEEEKEGEEIKYKFKGKGFSPVPTTKLGRIHVTIDKKVVAGLIVQGVLQEGTTLEDAFGASQKAFNSRRKKLRKKLRKLKKNKGGTKKQRTSVRTNGYGKLPCGGTVTSVLTDGVGLCIRTMSFNNELYERLLRWDGEGKFNQKKVLTQKDWTEIAQRKYEELIKTGYVRLIAIDPGREELFHSATIIDGVGKYEEHRFKRSKYVEVSLRNKMTDFVKHHKTKEICDIEGILAKNGGWKARTSADYEKVFESWMSENRALQMIDHYSHIGYALWKMRLYRRKESVLYQRYRRMIGDRYMYVNGKKVKVGVIVGYGSRISELLVREKFQFQQQGMLCC